MPSSALVLLGVLVVIAVVGSAAFIQDPNNVPVGYHPRSMGTTASSTNPSDGLELRLSLNATSFQVGAAVNVTVVEYNTLTATNNVTASDDWAVAGLTDGPCGTMNNPIGFDLLQGYYTASNVSSARSVELFAPGFYSCPALLSGITVYGFQPLSSTAAVYGGCTPGPCFTTDVSTGIVIRGDWGVGSAESSFHALSRGVYTVVSGDEWGVTAYLYFVVN